jgi:hypothetical protein
MKPKDFAGDNPTEEADEKLKQEWRIQEELDVYSAREEAKKRYRLLQYGKIELPASYPLGEFLLQEPNADPQLIKGLWNTGGSVLLAAQFKAGKTTLRDNAVRCLADGGMFLDKYPVTPIVGGSIVVIDLELSPDMMREWLRRQGIKNTDRVEVIPMRGLAHTLDWTIPEIRTMWADRLRALNCQVLILDCLRPALDALGLNENFDAGKFLNGGFDPLKREAGIPNGMVIHHMGHNGDRIRGDSSMLGWGDSWRLVRPGDDPAGKRFFTAYGREIDEPQQGLSLNRDTGHLTITGGTPRDAAAGADWDVIYIWLKEHEGVSQNAVVQAFNTKQTEYEPIPEKRVKAALAHAEKSNELRIRFTGKLGSTKKLYANRLRGSNLDQDTGV